MNGINRAIGGGSSIEFNGETLVIPAFTVRDFGTVEAHLIAQRRTELLRLVASVYRDFPPDIGEKMRREALDEARRIKGIAPREVFEWIDSLEGISFTIHLLINRAHPGKYTLAQVESIVYSMADDVLDALKMSRDVAAGTDPVGNATSSAQEATAAAARTSPSIGVDGSEVSLMPVGHLATSSN